MTKTYFSSNDRSQNTFLYQPTLDTLELKKDKVTDYVLSWKSKRIYNSKLKTLYTAFLHSIKPSGCKMGIKIDKDHLAAKQIHYLTKIVNVYIVYDLKASPKIPLKNVTLKNCLFRATNIAKNGNKNKWVYSGYGIAFDGKVEWIFGNDYDRNFIVFGVDNSSSSLADNLKNKVLILGE